MGYPIRPSNVRVYQFHHDGTGVTVSARAPRERAAGAERPARSAARRPGPRRTAGPGAAARPDAGLGTLGVRLLRDSVLTTEGFDRASNERQQERQHDEPDEGAGRQLVQERRRAARAERGLAASAAERAGDVRALPLLDQDHQDEEEADEDVEHDQRDVSDFHGTSAKKGQEVYAPAPERQGTVSSRRARPIDTVREPESELFAVLAIPAIARTRGLEARSADQETVHARRLQELRAFSAVTEPP